MNRIWDRCDEPGVEETQDFIQDREHLLNKALVDHTVWRQSLEQFGRDASLAATWVDHEGHCHVVAINRAYLQAHLKIVRSLMNDLAVRARRQHGHPGIVAVHAEMLGEDGTG